MVENNAYLSKKCIIGISKKVGSHIFGMENKKYIKEKKALSKKNI